MKDPKPKVLLYDLEIVAPLTKELHRALYTMQYKDIKDIMMAADMGYIVCFGYKWLGDKKAHCLHIGNCPAKNGERKDAEIVRQAAKLIKQADLLVAHYGKPFDIRYFSARNAINGNEPIPDVPQFDTCLIGRTKYKLSSSSLSSLATALGLPINKLKKQWPDWWLDVADGDKVALNKMVKYCIRDVDVLELVYLKLRPLKTIVSFFNGSRICNACHIAALVVDGHKRNRGGMYTYMHCKNCGHYQRGEKDR